MGIRTRYQWKPSIQRSHIRNGCSCSVLQCTDNCKQQHSQHQRQSTANACANEHADAVFVLAAFHKTQPIETSFGIIDETSACRKRAGQRCGINEIAEMHRDVEGIGSTKCIRPIAGISAENIFRNFCK